MTAPAWLDDCDAYARERLVMVPDAWQTKAFKEVSKPGKRRVCLHACAGPGKTAALAVIINWFMETQLDHEEVPNGICLSETEKNLKTNLWKEIAKWSQRDPVLTATFTQNSERFYNNEAKLTWFMEARSYPESADPVEVGKSLSGLHGDYVIVVLDEAGGMPPILLQRAEQALSSCKRGIIVVAGNPTSKSSALYAAVQHPDYAKIRITGDPDDPDRSPRIDIEWARAQIKEHGRDNPWVRSYILGEFPDAEFNGLLSPDDILKSTLRRAPASDCVVFERRLGVDVARYGDDSSVLFPRQGRQGYKPVIIRKQGGIEVARRVESAMLRWSPDILPAVFVDDTGGYGSSVIDHLRMDRYEPVPVNVSSTADDPDHYANRRAELHSRAAAWVKGGGCLPDIDGLSEEACATRYTAEGGKLKMEPKGMVKRRLGRSPDLWDAFCLTFAQPERYADGRTRGGSGDVEVDYTSASQQVESGSRRGDIPETARSLYGEAS